jgi:type II secretory pathway pseudopilin PulG
VEILATIGIIGILASVTVLALSNIFDSSRYNGYKRNAQNIVALQASASAAGAEFTATDTTDTVVAKLLGGVAGKGALSGTTFQIGTIPPDELAGAKSYLEYNQDSKLLKYNGAITAGH